MTHVASFHVTINLNDIRERKAVSFCMCSSGPIFDCTLFSGLPVGLCRRYCIRRKYYDISGNLLKI